MSVVLFQFLAVNNSAQHSAIQTEACSAFPRCRMDGSCCFYVLVHYRHGACYVPAVPSSVIQIVVTSDCRIDVQRQERRPSCTSYCGYLIFSLLPRSSIHLCFHDRLSRCMVYIHHDEPNTPQAQGRSKSHRRAPTSTTTTLTLTVLSTDTLTHTRMAATHTPIPTLTAR